MSTKTSPSRSRADSERLDLGGGRGRHGVSVLDHGDEIAEEGHGHAEKHQSHTQEPKRMGDAQESSDSAHEHTAEPADARDSVHAMTWLSPCHVNRDGEGRNSKYAAERGVEQVDRFALMR